MPVLPRGLTPATRFWVFAVTTMTVIALAVAVIFSLGRLCSNRHPRVLPSQRIRDSLLSFTEHFRPRPFLPRSGLRSVQTSKPRGAIVTQRLRPTIPAPLHVLYKPSSEITLYSLESYREPGASLETGRTTLAPRLGDQRRPLSPIYEKYSSNFNSSGRHASVSQLRKYLDRDLPPLPI